MHCCTYLHVEDAASAFQDKKSCIFMNPVKQHYIIESASTRYCMVAHFRTGCFLDEPEERKEDNSTVPLN